VDGRRHVVKVIGGDAEIEESRHGKKLLRIKTEPPPTSLRLEMRNSEKPSPRSLGRPPQEAG
jgi:hypothetical protein